MYNIELKYSWKYFVFILKSGICLLPIREIMTKKDKGRAIKLLVVSYVALLGSMKAKNLRTSAERGSGPLLWSGCL